MTFRFDEERDNTVAKESQLREAAARADFDEPSEYEWTEEAIAWEEGMRWDNLYD